MAPPNTPPHYDELPLGTLDPDRVEALWRYQHLERRRQLVLPDGRMDLVAHATVHRDGRIDAVSLAIAGPADQPCAMQLRPGVISLGARFRLGWGGVCFGLEPALARNRVIVGPQASALLGALAPPLQQCRSVDALQAALAHTAGVLSAGAASDARHAGALRAIARLRRHVAADRTRRPPTDTAREAERSMRRHVLAATGLSLRSLAGVLRFQHAMDLLTSGAVASLAELAALAGYADQPHMTRAFRRFGGFTPALPVATPVVGAR